VVFHLKKLYVGNLPYTYNDESLAALFAEYGEVISAVIIMDRASGRSKGFGFVEMEDEDAVKAMEALEGQDIDGRNVRVNEARPKREDDRRY